LQFRRPWPDANWNCSYWDSAAQRTFVDRTQQQQQRHQSLFWRKQLQLQIQGLGIYLDLHNAQQQRQQL
jgi:hypothetical protein